MADPGIVGVVFTAKEKARLKPIDSNPKPLCPDEVAGPTLYSLVSPGTETFGLYAGTHPKIKYPSRPGYSAVFRAEEIGNEISDITEGDLLFTCKQHQSWQRVDRENVYPVPEGLSPELMLFVRMAKITMSSFAIIKAQPPDKVIVTGLGLVGLLGAQAFKLSGYEVIGVDPDETRRHLAVEHGIDKVFPSIPLDDPDITGQVGLVLECSGHQQAVIDGCKVVRPRGEVVLVGVPWQPTMDTSAWDVLDPVFHNLVDLKSGWERDLPHHSTPNHQPSQDYYFELAGRWLAEGKMKINDDTYKTVSPRDCQQVYQDILHRRMGTLSMIFDWNKIR